MLTTSWIMGSTAYGLVLPDSDIDIINITFDAQREVIPFSNLLPSKTVKTDKGDVTTHTVHKLCQMLAKGNPNVVELIWYTPISSNFTELTEMLEYVDRNNLTRNNSSFGQYFGHISSILHRLKEDTTVTNKQFSHALRLAHTLDHTLEGKRYKLVEDEPTRLDVLRTKQYGYSKDDVQKLADMYTRMKAKAQTIKYNTDSAEPLKEYLNNWYADLIKGKL